MENNKEVEGSQSSPLKTSRPHPSTCDHTNPEIKNLPEDNGTWSYFRAYCKCGLNGPSWHYADGDEAGRVNARIEVETWWAQNMAPAPRVDSIKIKMRKRK